MCCVLVLYLFLLSGWVLYFGWSMTSDSVVALYRAHIGIANQGLSAGSWINSNGEENKQQVRPEKKSRISYRDLTRRWIFSFYFKKKKTSSSSSFNCWARAEIINPHFSNSGGIFKFTPTTNHLSWLNHLFFFFLCKCFPDSFERQSAIKVTHSQSFLTLLLDVEVRLRFFHRYYSSTCTTITLHGVV